MAASADPKQLSPKVTAAALAGVLVFALGEALSLVTVEQFGWAGGWAGALHTFVTVGAMAFAAYWKGDPLRQNYAEQVRARQAVEAAKLDQAAADEQSALAVEPEGKHRAADPVVYNPPTDLIG